MPIIPNATAITPLNPTSVVFAAVRDILDGVPTPVGGWSSIIGIVTAIIGNVLISFALNTQRYAHLRLQRATDSRKDGNDHESHPNHTKSYGTVQKEIAEARRKKNAQAEHGNISDETEHASAENEAETLIPHIQPPSSGSSFVSEDEEPHDEKTDKAPKSKNYLRSPWWWLGITLMVVGEAGNFLAYGFAPASIVSPLGVVALISNCLIAPIMLKEKFRWRDALGVVIAVAGAVIVVMSAKGSNPKLGPDDIIALLKRWEFLTYFGITTAAIIVLMFLSNKYGGKTILIDIGLVGLFGGYTALSTKGVASLLSYRLFQVFTFPISYLLVVVLVFTAVMQIKYLNRALQRFNSTQVIPTQFVVFTIFVVVGSAIVYRDFERTTAAKVGQFLGGVALTFLGVWFITGGRDDESDSKPSNEASAEEGRIALVDDEANEYQELSPQRTRPGARRTSTTMNIPDLAKPFFATTQSATDIHSGIAKPSTASRPQTPQRPFSRAISTPIFRKLSFTPIQHPAHAAQPSTPPQSPSPRRPGGPSRRPLSDVSASGLAFTNSQANQESQLLSPSVDVSASSGTAAGARHQLSARHASFVGRVLSLPGPLTSPLSGGLSAVVADSIRRNMGVDIEAISPQKRPRSRSRRRTSERNIRSSLTIDGAVEDRSGEATGSGSGTARNGLARSESQAVEDGDDIEHANDNNVWIDQNGR